MSTCMMTSSNGNIFRVTGPLCGEFTGPGEFPTQRPVTRSFDFFFDLCRNKRLSKQPWGWWFETLSWSLWRHRNGMEHKNYGSTARHVASIESNLQNVASIESNWHYDKEYNLLNMLMWSFNKNMIKHRTLTIVSWLYHKQWLIIHIFNLILIIQWGAYINVMTSSYWKKRFSWRAFWFANYIVTTKWLIHRKVRDFLKRHTSAFFRFKGGYKSHYDWKYNALASYQ